jgi:hypothetical protein
VIQVLVTPSLPLPANARGVERVARIQVAWVAGVSPLYTVN